MSTVNELLVEIKKGCPEQTIEIDKLISNIDKTTLSKTLHKKEKSDSKNKKKLKTVKKSDSKIKDIKLFLKDKSNLNKTIEYNQVNPKLKTSKAYQRYENYKSATIISDVIKLGGSFNDMVNDYNKRLLKIIDNKSSTKSSAESSTKPSEHGIPFSSIEGCGHIDFTDDNLELIKKDSFIKRSKHFTEITTDDDGNCGYHSIIQGLIESYYILGGRTNDNLKQFIKNIKEKLNLDPKQIISANRKNNKITIPRQVVNHFRRFILDVPAPDKIMPDGTPIHIIERENEVPTYIWDPKNEKYTKKKLKADFIKENQNKNKRIVNSIKGGIKDTGTITSSYWLREEVINSIVSIFDITIYSFMNYIDDLYEVDRFINTPDFKGKQSEGHEEKFGKGHVIFMVNNGTHFTYLKTDIQGYNNNILKCLGLYGKDSSSSSSPSNEDINKLMDMFNITKKDAEDLLDQADGDIKKAANMKLQQSKTKAKTKTKTKSKTKTNSSSTASSNYFKPVSSMISSSGSVLTKEELDNIDYLKNPKLYEQELYKIIRKQMPNSTEPEIKKKFDDQIKEIKLKK